MTQLIAQKPIGTIDPIGERFAPKEVATDTSAAISSIESIFSTVLGFLTIVAGLSFLIYFVIGALNWVLAGGDSKKVDTAKSYMTNGAIGLIVVVSAYAIISIVGRVLGLPILDLNEGLSRIPGISTSQTSTPPTNTPPSRPGTPAIPK